MAADSQTHVKAVDLIYLLLGVFSLLLNGIMVYVTLRQRRGSWAIDITLLLLIGVSDILAGLVAVVLQFWKLNSSYTAAYAGSNWCYANAVLSHSTLLATITLTALLALVRYLTIVRGKSVSNRICTVAAMFLISLCWASSVAKGCFQTPSWTLQVLFALFPTRPIGTSVQQYTLVWLCLSSQSPSAICCSLTISVSLSARCAGSTAVLFPKASRCASMVWFWW
ncbi:hypothetical protein DSO57_1020695 [Entomophthora muscae]|uniref:Uncharacterized protein n=1 Tax=Entomophthora muscae TaxID=34485 RepID=A0ACC2SSV6_9FUNG|nr:hypothetical protein DSO57_1020695 [Entomophthora muscae]